MVTRIAVIGAGLIGRKHLGILKDDPAFEVTGIADPSLEAATYAREMGLVPAMTQQMQKRTIPDRR